MRVLTAVLFKWLNKWNKLFKQTLKNALGMEGMSLSGHELSLSLYNKTLFQSTELWH
jgi:hypothetical protein